MDTTTAFDRRIAAINKGEGRAWAGPIVEVVDTVQTLCLGLTEASGGVPPTDILLAAALEAVMQRKARAEKVADDETAALRAAHGE